MNDSVRTGWRRLIAALCVVFMCVSSFQVIASGSEDLEHVLEIAHVSAIGDNAVHYCQVSAEACERQPHHGDANTAPHHHHGDPTSGFVITSPPAFSVAIAVDGMTWPTDSPVGHGLGQSALERPPKA